MVQEEADRPTAMGAASRIHRDAKRESLEADAHGPVAALSLVWSFLRDVLQEVRDLDARRQSAAPAAAP
jgi:hypothetical protein